MNITFIVEFTELCSISDISLDMNRSAGSLELGDKPKNLVIIELLKHLKESLNDCKIIHDGYNLFWREVSWLQNLIEVKE